MSFTVNPEMRGSVVMVTVVKVAASLIHRGNFHLLAKPSAVSQTLKEFKFYFSLQTGQFQLKEIKKRVVLN